MPSQYRKPNEHLMKEWKGHHIENVVSWPPKEAWSVGFKKREKSIDAHSEHPLGLIGHHGLTQDQIQQSGRAEGGVELAER